jgi:hypothetical protein
MAELHAPLVVQRLSWVTRLRAARGRGWIALEATREELDLIKVDGTMSYAVMNVHVDLIVPSCSLECFDSCRLGVLWLFSP